MNKGKIGIFINRDFEIRDLEFTIDQLLKNSHKVEILYNTKTKNKTGIKYFDVERIIEKFKGLENFEISYYDHKINRILSISRLVHSIYCYYSRENSFTKLFKRFALDNKIFFFYKFRYVFDNFIFKYFFKIINIFLEKIFINKKLINLVKEKKINKIMITALVQDSRMPQTDLVKIAKVLGIPSIYLVRSWDNLTNKAVMNIFPDQIYVWNNFQKEEIKKFHKNEISKIFVVGAHLYEYIKHFNVEKFKNLFEEEGKNSSKIKIVYMGSSPQIVKNEAVFLLKLLKKIQIEDKFKICKFIYRPHPLSNTKNKSVKEINDELQELINIGVEIPLAKNSQDTNEYIKNVFNKEDYLKTILESDILLGINTSAMIEASYFKKKIFIAPDNFDHGVEGLFSDTYHFSYLKNANLKMAKSFNSIEDFKENIDQEINQILKAKENTSNKNIETCWNDEFLNLKNKTPSKEIAFLVSEEM